MDSGSLYRARYACGGRQRLLHNESKGQVIYPTPVIGMLGLIEDIKHVCTQDFKEAGDLIILLGANKGELGGSEYLQVIHGLATGCPPELDLHLEKRVQDMCLQAIREGLVRSAHDCSEGGLAAALAECCILGELGAKVRLDQTMSARELLYGESHSRIVVSTKQENLDRLQELADQHGVPWELLGHVENDVLEITGVLDDKARTLINLSVQELKSTWREAIKCHEPMRA